MLKKITFIFLSLAALSGCQSISSHELQVLNDRASKADKFEAENNTLKQQQSSLIKSVSKLNKQLEQEILTKQVSVEQNDMGGIKVTLQQDILFSSGSYKVDQKGAFSILKKVVDSIDMNGGNSQLRIVGHTDNLPVSQKWHDKFSDNWDLSTRRAGEVARHLIWGAHFPKENITVSGRADVEPVASNDTPEGRAKNRRIELFIDK